MQLQGSQHNRDDSYGRKPATARKPARLGMQVTVRIPFNFVDVSNSKNISNSTADLGSRETCNSMMLSTLMTSATARTPKVTKNIE